MSSMCAASSSIACCARWAALVRRACASTSAGQSWRGVMSGLLGVLHAGHLAERGDEAAPVGALIREHAPAGLGDAVIAAAALAGFLDPPRLDPAAILE